VKEWLSCPKRGVLPTPPLEKRKRRNHGRKGERLPSFERSDASTTKASTVDVVSEGETEEGGEGRRPAYLVGDEAELFQIGRDRGVGGMGKIGRGGGLAKNDSWWGELPKSEAQKAQERKK